MIKLSGAYSFLTTKTEMWVEFPVLLNKGNSVDFGAVQVSAI